MVQPAEQPDFDEAMRALEESRARLLDAMQKASGLALGSVTAPHPRLGTLTVYEWLLMIARHEERHAEQVREIHATLSSLPNG